MKGLQGEGHEVRKNKEDEERTDAKEGDGHQAHDWAAEKKMMDMKLMIERQKRRNNTQQELSAGWIRAED